ncbi:hypothetical protein F2Q68_00040839 [Brassica cretica]|uniref:Uncharacterized protein n=1 Tax=Brassica cretica TaxID=69181 RepID=A0A8S9MHG5_BRACR|nr:hypothetical protein F2Q68_00040839 [Brassica cretica]
MQPAVASVSSFPDFRKFEAVVVLVGNKSDLGQSREVEEDEGKSLAELEGLYFLETSALQNQNVEEAFLSMIERIHEVLIQKIALDKKSNGDDGDGPVVPAGREVVNIDEVTATRPLSTSFSNCCLNVANWISSKLKAAETILQQIDQQAAESLRKDEKPETTYDEASETFSKSASLVSLRKKTYEGSGSSSDGGSQRNSLELKPSGKTLRRSDQAQERV